MIISYHCHHVVRLVTSMYFFFPLINKIHGFQKTVVHQNGLLNIYVARQVRTARNHLNPLTLVNN